MNYYYKILWAKDGSYGDRTPIYMLNHIIRQQAILEITNQTAQALELLSKQNSQMRTALDYLLTEEERVCGKFNLSNCCLQIEDNGRAVKTTASKI